MYLCWSGGVIPGITVVPFLLSSVDDYSIIRKWHKVPVEQDGCDDFTPQSRTERGSLRPVHIAREVEVHLRQKRTSLDQKEYWWTQAQEEKEHRRKCNEGNRNFLKEGYLQREVSGYLFIILYYWPEFSFTIKLLLRDYHPPNKVWSYYPWTVPILKGLLPRCHQQEWMQVIQTDMTICDTLIYTDALYGGSWPKIHCYLLLPF